MISIKPRIVDYQVIRDISILFEKKVILYGAGFWSNVLITELNRSHIKVNKIVQTTESESVETIASIKDDADSLLILASFDYYEEMLETINGLHYEKINICTIYAVFLSMLINRDHFMIPNDVSEQLAVQYETAHRHYVTFCMLSTVDDVYSLATYPHAVLIYQPGKVGSKTIYQSLLKLEEFKHCLHLHTLILPFVYGVKDKDTCKKFCGLMKRSHKKIISLVRNPFMRDFSSFFEGTDDRKWPHNIVYNNIFCFFADYLNTNEDLSARTLKERDIVISPDLCRTCEKYMLNITRSRGDEFSWFDYEMKSVFGIDVYAYPFDKDKGYTVIRQDSIELLLLKLEKLDDLMDIVGQFLGKSDFQLKRSNEANKKIYRYLYNYIRKNMTLSQEYVNYYLQNKKALHFYSETELRYFYDTFHMN